MQMYASRQQLLFGGSSTTVNSSSTMATCTPHGSTAAFIVVNDSDSVRSDDKQQQTRSSIAAAKRQQRITSYIPDKRVAQISVTGATTWWSSGKAAGRVFQQNEFLKNPVCGLMIGVLSTVLVQSSSTSTSIVVTMVANGLLTVPLAIPIIFGANIGTSVTNTIVSLAQGSNRDEFRRAFAGATVHDAFNWLTVLTLLPLEILTGFLYSSTKALVDAWHPEQHGISTNSTTTGASSSSSSSSSKKSFNFLGAVTNPLTHSIIELDKKVIEAVATGDALSSNRSLIKEFCSWKKVQEKVSTSNASFAANTSSAAAVFMPPTTATTTITREIGDARCRNMVRLVMPQQSETFIGIILLVASILMLVGCLLCVVKSLNAMLKGSLAKTIQKYVNQDLPRPFGYFTNWVALVIGAVITVLLQSSSVFTSTLTPLVGIGMVSLERMYPLTLGSNVGTTGTGLLAALSASGNLSKLKPALHIALCHLFFNLAGIALFFPVPFMRWPLTVARLLGNTTAKYKWFAIFYIVVMFFALPLFVFLLSLNLFVFQWVGGPLLLTFLLVLLVNVLQRQVPKVLPQILTSWKFLPHWMHSLKPVDAVFRAVFGRICPNKCLVVCCEAPQDDESDFEGESGTDFGQSAMNGDAFDRNTNKNFDAVIAERDNDSDVTGGITFMQPNASNFDRIDRVGEKFSDRNRNGRSSSAVVEPDAYTVKRIDSAAAIYQPVSRDSSTDSSFYNASSGADSSKRKAARKTRRALNLLRIRQNSGVEATLEQREEAVEMQQPLTAAAAAAPSAEQNVIVNEAEPVRARNNNRYAGRKSLTKVASTGQPSTRSIAAMVSATIKHNEERDKHSEKQQHYGGPLRHSFYASGGDAAKSDSEKSRQFNLTGSAKPPATAASIAEHFSNIVWPTTTSPTTLAEIPAGYSSSSAGSSLMPSRATSWQQFPDFPLNLNNNKNAVGYLTDDDVILMQHIGGPLLRTDAASAAELSANSAITSTSSSSSTTPAPTAQIAAPVEPPHAVLVTTPTRGRNITVQRVLSNVSSGANSTTSSITTTAGVSAAAAANSEPPSTVTPTIFMSLVNDAVDDSGLGLNEPTSSSRL